MYVGIICVCESLVIIQVLICKQYGEKVDILVSCFLEELLLDDFQYIGEGFKKDEEQEDQVVQVSIVNFKVLLDQIWCWVYLVLFFLSMYSIVVLIFLLLQLKQVLCGGMLFWFLMVIFISVGKFFFLIFLDQSRWCFGFIMGVFVMLVLWQFMQYWLQIVEGLWVMVLVLGVGLLVVDVLVFGVLVFGVLVFGLFVLLQLVSSNEIRILLRRVGLKWCIIGFCL